MTVAPMRLARLALPVMRERGEGRIINVSSIYGRTTTPLTGWYQATKHALEALSDALRMEVASSGVKVVLVEPGGFKTGIWEDFARDVEGHAGSRFEGAYRRSLQTMKLTQVLMGQPKKVAGVIGRDRGGDRAAAERAAFTRSGIGRDRDDTHRPHRRGRRRSRAGRSRGRFQARRPLGAETGPRSARAVCLSASRRRVAAPRCDRP